MSRTNRTILRHALAAAGSFMVLPVLWYVGNPLLHSLLAGGRAAEGLEGLASPFWCCRSGVWLLAVVVPVSWLAEEVLVRRLGLRAWVHGPLVALLFFGAGATFLSVLGWALFHQWTEPLAWGIVGLDDALWGTAYWALFRLSDRLPGDM